MNKIISILAYFDVFDHPLDAIEISEFTGVEQSKTLDLLEQLVEQKLMFQLDEFYSLQDDIKLVQRRKKGAERARNFVHQANKKARLISKFPYVTGVYISGSLSKGQMGEDGDIDYFIVTKENRLWVARTLLILYKKMFLLNSRKCFCVNYFIDENSLEIENRNIFTAIELSTLLPMYNAKQYRKLMESNSWITEYADNRKSRIKLDQIRERRSFFKRISEPILNTKLGDILDDKFMHITLKKWRNKFPNLADEDFEIAMKTSKRVSKHHPSNFQKKVLDKYEKRMKIMDSLSKKTA